MLRSIIAGIAGNLVIFDLVGLVLLTTAAYLEFGTAAAMAAAGGCSLAIRMLADGGGSK